MKLQAFILSGVLALAPVFEAQAEPSQKKSARFSGLTMQDGQTMEKNWFEGQYGIGYAGFTQCPAVCPMIRRKISQIMKVLAQEGITDIVPFMLAIDSAHDTSQALQDYIGSSGMTAFTGTAQEVARAAKALGVVYDAKTNEHDPLLRVVDGQGHVIAEIPSVLPVPQLVTLIKAAIAKEGKVTSKLEFLAPQCISS